MKKFSLLLSLCLAALIVPQRMWATSSINVSGNTLTINSDNAGWLSSQTKTDAMKACTTIVLIGKFNASDLSSIQQSGSDFNATTVDMSEAQFISTTSTPSTYTWFKESTSGTPENGTHAYVGGKLYQLSVSNVWIPIDGPVEATEYATIALRDASGATPPAYGKIPQYMYCQMHISNAKEWVNVDTDHSGTVNNVSWLENSLSTYLDDDTNYPENTIVKVKRYYKLVKDNQNNLVWTTSEVYPTDAELSAATTVFNANWVRAIEGALDVNSYTVEGDYIFFEHYFKKVASGTKTWINDTATEQTGAETGNFNYSDRNSNKSSYETNNQWVRMNNGYAYYQLVEERTWTEEETSTTMTAVPYHFEDDASMNANTAATNGQYAIVGGTEYIYDEASWNEVIETADWSQAKFSYWSNTITTAICPTGVAPSSLSSEMLQNCSHLTYIDFGNINVDISGSTYTYSAETNTGTVNYSDLLALMMDHGWNSSPDNGLVLYGDNINTINYGTFTMSFSGSAADRTVTLTNSGSSSVSIEQKYAKSTTNCKTIKFVGKFNGLNSFDLSDPVKQHTTLDFSDATIDNNGFELAKWKSTATKLIFAEGEATIGGTAEDGSTLVNIKADNNANYNTVKGYMIANGTYPEGTGSGNYTYTERKNLTVTTKYDKPTLVIGTDDTDNIGTASATTLTSIINDKSASGFTTITFADGSTYDKATGVLTTTSDNYQAIEDWIAASDNTVSKIQLGKYVYIENGVTVIDNTVADKIDDGLITQNLSGNTNLTNAEKTAIKLATSLKLKGKFRNDDFLGLKNVKNGADATQVLPTKLDLSDAVLHHDQTIPTDWATSVTDIEIPRSFIDYTGETPTTVYEIPASFCENFTGITSIEMPNTITSVGESAFRGCTSLHTVDWSTALTEIKAHAFERCGFGSQTNATKAERTLTIPPTVKYIREDAFRDCADVNYLVIPSNSVLERIESGAFFSDTSTDVKDGLKEVHVDCNHFIWCDVNAFDDAHTNGHSAVATAKCRLFYPAVGVSGYDPNYPEGTTGSTNDSFQDYVGAFKAECFNDVMTQADLNDLKVIVTTGQTREVTSADGTTTTTKSFGPYDGHGWYMFTSTGIGFTSSTTWRTYSEAVPYKVPRESVAKFYLVWDCTTDDTRQYDTDVDTDEDKTKDKTTGLLVKLVQMNPGDLVPANTGVLINYVAEIGSTSVVIPLDYVQNDNTVRYDAAAGDNKYSKNSKSYSNYLRKINNEEGDGIEILNVETNSAGEATYRNFFFGNITQLNSSSYKGKDFDDVIGKNIEQFSGWMFLRAQSGVYNVNNKAYLHLPASMTGGTTIGSTSDFSDRIDERASDGYQTRLIGMIITDRDDESEQTIVKYVKRKPFTENDNDIYTLQGQKVKTPAVKGIYIHNGKKVIVK